MGIIRSIKKMTETRFLNLYELQRENEEGPLKPYYFASRAKALEDLKMKTKETKPDGVIIYSVFEDKVVLIRQYRYPIDGYIYEFPAGLVDEGEDMFSAGVREFKEETGLDLEVLPVSNGYTKPFYTTVGMTDEACGTIFGYASGMVTKDYLERGEEIEVVLADKKEVKRILKEENVAIMCSYMLMHFLKDENPFEFLKELD